MTKYLLAGLATVLLAPSANAAVTLTSVSVTGVTSTGTPSSLGTFWDTANEVHYAVFVSSNDENAFNPNKNLVPVPITFGNNAFTIQGAAYTPENYYKLTLMLSNGVLLSQVATIFPSSISATSSVTVAGVRYTLDGFDWNVTRTDRVGIFSNTPDGKRGDFLGDFALSATAVPEPASWAMMLVGFGMVGFAARRRAKSAIKVIFA